MRHCGENPLMPTLGSLYELLALVCKGKNQGREPCIRKEYQTSNMYLSLSTVYICVDAE
jgi:hypothetical protein